MSAYEVQRSCLFCLNIYENASLRSKYARISIRVAFIGSGYIAGGICKYYHFLSPGVSIAIALTPLAITFIDLCFLTMGRCLKDRASSGSLGSAAEHGSIANFKTALETATDEELLKEVSDKTTLLRRIIDRYINEGKQKEKLKLLLQSGKGVIDDYQHSPSKQHSVLRDLVFEHSYTTDQPKERRLAEVIYLLLDHGASWKNRDLVFEHSYTTDQPKERRLAEVIYLLLDHGASWKNMDEHVFVHFAYLLFKDQKTHYLKDAEAAFVQQDVKLAGWRISVLFLTLYMLAENDPENRQFFTYFLDLVKGSTDFQQTILIDLRNCSEETLTCFYHVLLSYFDYQIIDDLDLTSLFFDSVKTWIKEAVLNEIDDVEVLQSLTNSLVESKQTAFLSTLQQKIDTLKK